MGLGKTIQTIAFLAYLKEKRKVNGPHLIVAPNTTLGNWFKELRKWLPSFRTVKLYARKEYREETFEKYLKPGHFDICITSYEGLNICKTKLLKFNWKYVIIDEAHRLKNEQSLLAKNLREFNTDLRLLITGTPLQNNLHELWSLLNYLLPDLFNNSDIFDYWFTGKRNEDDIVEVLKPEEQEKKNVEMINSLHRILKPFILRRTKADLETQLPPKKEIHVYVGLSELQCKIYKNVLLRKQGVDDKKFYMNVLMQLRKACNHPYQFEGAEPEGSPALGEHLVTSCGKLLVLSKLLKKLAGKSQVLIFSQMTAVLNILEDYMNFRGYKYVRIDGETFIEDRDAAIEAFVAPNSDKFVFLLSTRAGGLGINQATADTVVLYDSDWNPQVDLQAIDRAHRIGQTKPVNVYRLITENSIEEKIIERQKVKLKWDNLVVQKGKLAEKGQKMDKEDQKSLINFGANEIFKSESGTITDEDIDQLLIRGEERTRREEAKINKRVEAKANLDLNVASINIYEFEGDDYLTKKKADEIALQNAYYENLEKNLGTRRQPKYDSIRTTDNTFKPKPKQVRLPEWHFYQDRDRLLDLLNKEAEIKCNISIIRREGDDELPWDERQEKDNLLTTGLSDWMKQDYYNFIKGCERFGRTSFEKTAVLIETKTVEEVKAYSEVFWNKILELPDGDRIVKNIEKGEQGIESRRSALEILEYKCQNVDHFEDLDFKDLVYNKYKSRVFTHLHDKFLIHTSNKVGYGNFTEIKALSRGHNAFKFDHYFKSKTEGDLNKRMHSLLKMLKSEKESEDIKNKQIEEGLIDPVTGKPQRRVVLEKRNICGEVKEEKSNMFEEAFKKLKTEGNLQLINGNCDDENKSPSKKSNTIMSYCTGKNNGVSAFSFLDRQMVSCVSKEGGLNDEVQPAQGLSRNAVNANNKKKNGNDFKARLDRKLKAQGHAGHEVIVEEVENELDNKENMPQDEVTPTKHKKDTTLVEENGIEENFLEQKKVEIEAKHHLSNEKENTPLTRSKQNVDISDKQRSILEFCSKTTEKKGN